MPASSWACAQVWSKAECFRKGVGSLGTSGEEAATFQECGTGCFAAFPLFGDSEPVGFGERDRRFQMTTPSPLSSFPLPLSVSSSTSETTKYSLGSIIFNWLGNGVDALVSSGKSLVSDLSHPLILRGMPAVLTLKVACQ